MKHTRRQAWVVATLVTVVGCGGVSVEPDGGGGGADASQVVLLQGQWEVCTIEPGGMPFDRHENLVITATEVMSMEEKWDSSDGSCTGYITSTDGFTANYTIGNTVDTTLGGGQVSALEIDLVAGPNMMYSIVFVDAGASPDLLYVGDDSGVNDGSTPALRPTTLQEDRPFHRL